MGEEVRLVQGREGQVEAGPRVAEEGLPEERGLPPPLGGMEMDQTPLLDPLKERGSLFGTVAGTRLD
jgi:hypothetical protein